MSTPTTNDTAAHSTVFSAIARADRNWCQQACDDPLDDQRISHLAAAMQQLVDNGSGGADPAELARVFKELTAEHWTVEQLRGQLTTVRADYATLAGERGQVAEANTRLTQELDQLRSSYDALAAELAAAHSDNAELADELATARTTIEGHAETLTAALTDRDRLIDELAATNGHRCQWEWDPATDLYYDCSCGRWWPRYEPDGGEPIEPELEPLEALMARVRRDLDGWGAPSTVTRSDVDRSTDPTGGGQ